MLALIDGPNWQKVFQPDTPLLEIFVRGTVMYLGLFVLLRLVLKRQSGAVGITDLLVIVLIADAAQNAMAANYSSISDGLILVSVLIFWNYLLDWLGYHVPFFERIVRPAPLALIRNGVMLRRNMRQELITEEELMVALRQQGLEDPKQVRSAHMEGDGRISIIPVDKANGDKQPKKVF